jgi:putative membrane protein
MTSHTAGRTALFLALAIVTLGVALGSAQAASNSLRMGQEKFLKKAAQDGIAEVELGKLARDKAMRDEVRQFADRMVTDHAKANAEVHALASSNGVKLPTEPDRDHIKDLDKLRKLSGPEFDREYMRHMLKDHKDDVEDFRDQAKADKPNDVNRFAAKTLPVLEDHLRLAQSTYDIASSGKRSGDRETGSSKK